MTDAAWERIEPLLPRVDGRGRPWRDHRQVIDGVLWRLRTGSPWRDLPGRYGPWQTVYERFGRWEADRRSTVRSSSGAGRDARWTRCRAWRCAGRCPARAATSASRRSGTPCRHGACRGGVYGDRASSGWRVCPGPAAAAPGCHERSRQRRQERGVSLARRTVRGACCPSCPGRPDCARSAIPLFRTDRGRVHDRRGPVHLTTGPEFVQNGPMQPPPQPVLGPSGEPAVRGGRRDTESLRQMAPGTAAGQHVHHSRERCSLIDRGRASTLRTGSKRRQQRCDERPEFVRNQPLRQTNNHGKASCRIHLTSPFRLGTAGFGAETRKCLPDLGR
ncbi:transposase [Streptomyces sp. V4I23]|nr:transposase [Streptomyces sp. V4I23]